MKTIVTGPEEWLGRWFAGVQGTNYLSQEMQYVALTEGGEILAVAAFDNYNKANINMHIAAVPGKSWLNREFLWYCFFYPFEQLKVRRVTGIVAASNLQARKFDENLGFTLEATLKDAHPDGDLLVYKMTRDQCRWLTLKDRNNGKARRTTTTGLRSSG